ncbi:TPA: hypothetical protein ACHJX8_001731 [Yersinia enterocolitica]|uniref:Uncharacterized protein n=1 Tax=Yersinia massiliensis TaxID=419257 RepID=A0AA90Y4J9_9GAMM|nr:MULTISPECIES: hypothetical protein [Yersinia]MDA5550232.1 hypothetical protein [Yersinia massiliensis]NIL27784.1 hypothetical protein [Yersinia massiliensis]HEC1648633.1 hypothetical protein [Yersinia enterocolitica]
MRRKGLSSWERVSAGSISLRAAGGDGEATIFRAKARVLGRRPAARLG